MRKQNAPNLSIALELSTHTPSGTEVSRTPKAGQAEGAAGTAAASAIRVSALSKSFRIPLHAPVTLKERALHPFRRVEVDELEALRDINFEIGKGEFFGIVGRNGSGKSTLLKLIAGIYRADGGQIDVRGRISPFIELGVGFHPELAARDNIVINCALLGLTRAEALRRFDRIIEFADLERFVDLKLKNYSSGMQVRLAFSTAIQVDADILLLDEVLAVGDSKFQEKCFEVFRKMKQEGRTIVLVTHNTDIVQRFCDRAMVIHAGDIVAIGKPGEVIEAYTEMSRAEEDGTEKWQETSRHGDGSAEVLDAWFEDPAGERVDKLKHGERLAVCAEAVFRQPMEEPVFGFNLRNERGESVCVVNTSWDGIETGRFQEGERTRFRLELENVLVPGRYFADPAIANRDLTRMADLHEGMASVVVYGERWTPAMVDLPHQLTVETLG